MNLKALELFLMYLFLFKKKNNKPRCHKFICIYNFSYLTALSELIPCGNREFPPPAFMHYFSLIISLTTLQKVSQRLPKVYVPPLPLLPTTATAMHTLWDGDDKDNRFTFSATSTRCQTRFNNPNFSYKAYSVL